MCNYITRYSVKKKKKLASGSVFLQIQRNMAQSFLWFFKTLFSISFQWAFKVSWVDSYATLNSPFLSNFLRDLRRVYIFLLKSDEETFTQKA